MVEEQAAQLEIYQVWYVLGTSGPGVHDVGNALSIVLQSKVTGEISGGSVTYRVAVSSPKQAKATIKQMDDWFTKQDWYRDDSRVGFSAAGLIGPDGSEWNCEDCGGDIEECECI